MTEPKLDVAPVAAGEDAALYLNSLSDQHVVGVYLGFYAAAVALPPDDDELVELVRIRNGLAQSCEYCLSVRHASSLAHGEGLADKAMLYEHSDLPERCKAALRLAEAFLVSPSRMTAEARAQALEQFTPEELVGLLLKLTSFLVNKPRAALGIDGPLDAERLTAFDNSWLEKFTPSEG